MSVHVEEVVTQIEAGPPQRSAATDAHSSAPGPLAPKDVLKLVEQRVRRDLRMRAH